MSLPRVVHCVYREGLAGVFASQVLGPVRRVREAGVEVGLVTLQPVGEWFRGEPRRKWRVQRAAIRDALGDGGVFTRLPSPPARWRGLWDDVRTFAWWLRWHGRDDQILHCRGAGMTNLALSARRRVRQGGKAQPIIFDCRGVDHAEHLYGGGVRDERQASPTLRREWQHLRDAIERAATGADAVICVSQAMADYLHEQFGVERERMTVCPCAVNTQGFSGAETAGQRVRRLLGVGDRLVVVYCGSARSWQLPEQSVRMFKRIQRHERSAFFLVVTPHEQTMRRLLDQAQVGAADYHVTSAAHDEVAGYLGAADLGLLLREPCLVNAVASPVKFAEYLASGLPVVMTEQIGDYSALAEQRRVGCVVSYAELGGDESEPLASFLADVRQRRGAWRARCQRTAEQELSLDQHTRRMLRLYRRLAGVEQAEQEDDAASGQVKEAASAEAEEGAARRAAS